MALINCTECNKSISEEAKTCPGCGAPVVKHVSKGAAFVLIGFTVFFVAMCNQDKNKNTAASPPSPAQIQQEKDFQKAVGGLRYLRSTLKNPASFEPFNVLMIDSNTLCIQYRGKNSFNATVPGQYVFTDTVSSGDAKDWNRLCAGKLGQDLTHAKHAL